LKVEEWLVVKVEKLMDVENDREQEEEEGEDGGWEGGGRGTM
jgi:hypothetical protein